MRLIRWHRVREQRDRRNSSVLLTRAEIGGVLCIKKPDAFSGLLAAGIGRHRAYGYGLIMVEGMAPDKASESDPPVAGIAREIHIPHAHRSAPGGEPVRAAGITPPALTSAELKEQKEKLPTQAT